MSNNDSLRSLHNRPGVAFIVSAPSGAGKTTLCRSVQEQISGLEFSISHTTRTMRDGEVNGRDYHFIGEKDFRAMINQNAFAEWAEVHGNMYGTSLEEIERANRTGDDLLVEIDVQGAAQLRSKLPSAVFIYILPPNLSVLESRLRGRGTDAEESIQRRLTIALREIGYQTDYDYIIENKNLEEAIEQFASIVRAERLRQTRYS